MTYTTAASDILHFNSFSTYKLLLHMWLSLAIQGIDCDSVEVSFCCNLRFAVHY